MTRCLARCALLWLPLLLLELGEPYPWWEISATPTLRRVFAFSCFVWISLAALAAGGAYLSTLALRLAHSSEGRSELAAGILASAFSVYTRGTSADWASMASLPAEVRLALMLLVAGFCAGLLTALTAALAPGRIRRQVEIAWCALATTAWLGALSQAFEAPPLRLTLAVACSALAVMVLALQRSKRAPGARMWVALPSALLGVAVPLALMLAPGEGPGSLESRPIPSRAENVILIVVDTLRADHMSFGSYALDTTPGLAREFAGQSTVFSAASSVAVNTKPSVAALFTSRIREEREQEGPRPPTMAEIFERAGYDTAAFITNGLLNTPFFRRGFQEFSIFDGYRYFKSSFLLSDLLTGGDRWLALELLQRWRFHKVEAHELRARARRWLEQERDRPFFLYLHFVEPHWPYYDRGYGLIPEPPVEPSERLTFIDLLRRRVTPSPGSASLGELIGRYDEEVRSVDDGIARILGDLQELGLRDSTLVILTSDHGEEFFEHGRFSHGHDVFQEQVHVPLIFGWPRGQADRVRARRVDVPVSLADVLPTLIDRLELPVPDRWLLGHSFRPLIEGTQSRSRHPVLAWASSWSKQAYREGQLKVRITKGGVEVFDLSQDPHEQRPLANSPARTRLVQRARRSLAAVKSASGEAGAQAASPGSGDHAEKGADSAEVEGHGAPSPEELEDQALEELRALGYID